MMRQRFPCIDKTSYLQKWTGDVQYFMEAFQYPTRFGPLFLLSSGSFYICFGKNFLLTNTLWGYIVFLQSLIPPGGI